MLCLNNIIYPSDTYMCLFIFIHEMIYARHFSSTFTPQFRWNMILSMRSIDHNVSQQIIYIAYQLLITTIILITIKEESYLTISKIVSHFKYDQDREMKNQNGRLSVSFEQKLKLLNHSDFWTIYGTPLCQTYGYIPYGKESLYI